MITLLGFEEVIVEAENDGFEADEGKSEGGVVRGLDWKKSLLEGLILLFEQEEGEGLRWVDKDVVQGGDGDLDEDAGEEAGLGEPADSLVYSETDLGSPVQRKDEEEEGSAGGGSNLEEGDIVSAEALKVSLSLICVVRCIYFLLLNS